MKGKTLLSLAIVLAMVLSAMPIVAVKASPTTVEIVFEDGSHEIEYPPCTDFMVTLKIVDTPEITQWIARVSWDPDVVELQTGIINPPVEGDVMPGDFFPPAQIFLCKEPEVGGSQGYWLPEITSALLAGAPSGTGDLAYIYFHCKGIGDSLINLDEVVLLNGLVPVPCSPVHGLVHQPPPPATPPEAIFDVPSTVEVCTDIILDGSASTDGWDTVPDPGHACPITSYHWEIDVDGDDVTDWESYDEVTSYHCEGPGTIKITLTVTAPDVDPPSAPTYVSTDSETKYVMQMPPPGAAVIDVYTCNREIKGEGPGMDPETGEPLPYDVGWSDAYGPQEEVCVCAKVTYNDEPVEYKPVAFEMIAEDGTSVDFRVAYTDENGVACTTFRIPWQGSEAEAHFGDWKVYATVDVAGNIVMDLVQFRFGYLVSIRDITVIGSPLYKGDTLTVDVDLKSICMTSKNVLITVVLYDECGVPIGLAETLFTVDAEDGLASGFGITIPSWAFVGTGNVYVNVFNGYYPSAGGTPMCPEGSAIFTILNTP